MRPVWAIQIFYMQNTVCNVCGFDGLNALENYVVLKHQIGWGQGLGQGCTVSRHTLCVTTIDHNKACLQSGPLVNYHHATQPPFIVKVASLDKGFCREFLVACPCPPGALHEVLAADPRQGWEVAVLLCPGSAGSSSTQPCTGCPAVPVGRIFSFSEEMPCSSWHMQERMRQILAKLLFNFSFDTVPVSSFPVWEMLLV